MKDRLFVINVDDLDWVQAHAGGHFAASRKRLSLSAGGRMIGCSLYETDPGHTAWPAHCHYANEEAIYVLSGTGTLRLGDADYEVAPGQWWALVAGSGRPHQLRNSGSEPLRYLCLSTMEEPDIGFYPDSDKIGVFAGSAPGGPKGSRTLETFLPHRAAVTYWHGELAHAPAASPLEIVVAPLPERWPPVATAADAIVRDLEHGDRLSLHGETIGTVAGSQKLGCTLYTCHAGRYSFPRHAHLANEESLFVLEGTGVSFRGDNETPIVPGDYVVYPTGKEHAHTLRADDGQDLRYLCFSTRRSPEVVLYPDSNKLGAMTADFRAFLDADATIGYLDREPTE